MSFWKNLSESSLCFCLCLLLATQTAYPQTEHPNLKIQYASPEKKIDGEANDWQTDGAFSFKLENPFLDDTAFDNTVKIKLEWDENHLYGLAQIADNQLIKLRSGQDNPTLNLNDAIEIFIDPNFDSGHRMDVNDYQFLLDIGGDQAIFKGNKHFQQTSAQAPKEVGEATVALLYKTKINGTLNQENDFDEGWQAEFAIPWAALGQKPKAGMPLRLDFCADDMDSLVQLERYQEPDTILPYSFASWTGNRDFSFPDTWRTCELAGSPDFLTQLGRQYSRVWLMLFGLTAFFSVLIIGRMWLKIKQLKAIPSKSEMSETPFAKFMNEPAQSIFQTLPSSKPTNPQTSEPFNQLRDFVLANLSQDLSPEDLARKSNMSLRQLQRVFREEMELSPSNFILLLKMEKATELLRDGRLNVSEVAYELGFSDPGYFSKVFKKYFRVSPSGFGQSKPEQFF